MASGTRDLALRVAAAFLLLWLARLLEPLLLPLVCSTLIALLLSGAVERLQQRSLPAALATALALLLPAALLGGAAYLAAPRAVAELGQAWNAVDHQLRPWAERPDVAGLAARWALAAMQEAAAGGAARLGTAALPTVLGTAAVLMLGFFMLVGQRSLVAGLMHHLADRRSRLRWLAGLRDAREGVAQFIYTSALVNAALAVATGGALAAIGMGGAIGWGTVTFVLLFIPYLGPLAITLLLAAAGSATATGPILPAATFLALHAIEANVFSPWIMGHRLRVSRSMLLVAVQAGAFAWGVAGAVLAVPLLIVMHAVVRRRPRRSLARVLMAPEDARAPSLNATLAAVTATPHARREQPLPERVKDPLPCASPTSPRLTRPK